MPRDPRVPKAWRPAVAALLCALPWAGFALEINEANRAQLEQLNGLGVPTVARILDERARGGPFKDWDDLERRVKGLRTKKLDQLGAQGLTVSGRPRAPAGAPPAR